MKRFLAGLLVGLMLATASWAVAAEQPIKLIVNGKEVKTDVPPQIINGRTMVPVRFVAEPLGAKVEWDEQGQAVIINSTLSQMNFKGGTAMKLKINGVDSLVTNWKSTDDDLFIPGRLIVEFLSDKFKDQDITLDRYGNLKMKNQNYKLDTVLHSEGILLYSLKSLSTAGLIIYKWHPETANLELQ